MTTNSGSTRRLLFFSQITKILLALLILPIIVSRYSENTLFPNWLPIIEHGVMIETVPILILAIIGLLTFLGERRNNQQKGAPLLAEGGLSIITAAVCLYALFVPQGGVYWIAIPIHFFGGILALLALGRSSINIAQRPTHSTQ